MDNNGREIYEGSAYELHWIGYIYKGYVVFHNGAFALKNLGTVPLDDFVVRQITQQMANCMVEIGNIHENPELLEE